MMKQLCFSAIFISLALMGCASPGMAPARVASPVIEVTRQVVTIEAAPTEIVCTTSPGEVTLAVSPVTHTSARVELSGLKPGEKVVIHFFAQPTDQHARQVSDYPSEGADENGVFIVQVYSLSPSPDVVTNFWTVKVVHSGGVACAEVTLP